MSFINTPKEAVRSGWNEEKPTDGHMGCTPLLLPPCVSPVDCQTGGVGGKHLGGPVKRVGLLKMHPVVKANSFTAPYQK